MNVKKRVWVPVVGAIAAAALALTGCSSAGSNDSNKKVSLTYWMTGSDTDGQIMQVAADLYKKQHPNVTVKVQVVSWNDAHAKILSAASSQSGPDLISGGSNWGLEFGALGGMLDLRKYGVQSLESKVAPGVWNTFVATSGALYGVPLDVGTSVYVYRPDVFEAAGISKPPATWDELLSDITKLSAKDLSYSFVPNWGTFSMQDFMGYVFQAGGDFYNKDCTAGTLDTPQALKALTMWADVFKNSKVSRQTFDWGSAFASGKVGLVQDYSSILLSLDKTQPTVAGKWNLAPVPAGPAGSSTFVGGRMTGVMSYTKNPQAAADFIKFLYEPTTAAAMQKKGVEGNELYISALKGASDSLTSIPADQQKILSETLDAGNSGPHCDGWGDAAGSIGPILQSVVTNGVAPSDALKQANEILNADLKK